MLPRGLFRVFIENLSLAPALQNCRCAVMAMCLIQAALVHLCCVALVMVCTAKVVLASMDMLDAVGIESVACDLTLWLLVDQAERMICSWICRTKTRDSR